MSNTNVFPSSRICKSFRRALTLVPVAKTCVFSGFSDRATLIKLKVPIMCRNRIRVKKAIHLDIISIHMLGTIGKNRW